MDIEKLLKENKKSITQERKKIFVFIQGKHIFSVTDILSEFHSIGRASIFRTVKLFLGLGAIRRIRLSEHGEIYELNDISHHHEHMKCQKCEEILSFDSHSICKKIFEEAKKNGFVIKEHSLSVLGLCKNCSHL